MSQTRGVLETIRIPVNQIKPSPYQPRLTFSLEDIRGSIQRDGILVPLTVRKKDGYYELIDGERRVRLAKELGYKTVPCTVIDVDDETARRMVWKINTLRQEYSPKEKAYYFKKLQEEYGMSLRGIARDCDYHPNAVLAHLNVFKLPQKYQDLIWEKGSPLTVGHIQELEPLFSGNVLISTITDRLDLIIERKLTVHEFRDVLKPDLEKVRERRIEAAKEVVKEVAPVPKVKLETAEDFEEAAKVLRREAKRRKTPEQIREEKRRKARKTLDNITRRMAEARGLISVDKYEKQIEGLETVIEEEPDQAISKLKMLNGQLQANLKKVREEEERKRMEDEARKKVERELLTDEKFLRKAAELAPPPNLEVIEEAPTELEEVSLEELQEVRKRWESLQEEVVATLMKPEVKKRGDLFMNWLAHGSIMKVLGSARCPICGSDWRNLVWKCHDLNVEEAYRKTTEKYQKSVREGR